MGTWTIPMEDAGDLGAFYFTATLDGTDYEFQFQYNAREGAWYFDLLDLEGNYIRAGLKVVINWPLLLRCQLSSRPPGELSCMETLAEPTDPTLEDLGTVDLFTYTDQDSLP